YFTVTIDDIQAVHGIRTPGPAEAKRDFALAFVAESHGRLLNPTEMTFYETLADHYTKMVPATDPDPYMSYNWPPVTRFFGEGTTWRRDIPCPNVCHGRSSGKRPRQCRHGGGSRDPEVDVPLR